jgi:hypothetical protein
LFERSILEPAAHAGSVRFVPGLNKRGKVLVLYVQAKVSRKHHHRGDECDVGEPESMGSLVWPLDDQ